MQKRSDSNILLGSAVVGAGIGVVYWLVEYFFSAIIPYLRISAHSLHTLHPGLTSLLLGLYLVAGAAFGIAAGLLSLRRRLAALPQQHPEPSLGRAVYLPACTFSLLCLASFLYTQKFSEALVQPGFYVLALLSLALLVGFSRGIRVSPRRRTYRLMLGGILLLLAIGNAFLGVLDFRLFLFLPAFILISQLLGGWAICALQPAASRRRPSLAALASLLLVAIFLGHAFLVRQQPFEPAVPPAQRNADSSWPNVIVIVLDTVRADHLSVYGYSRETTPNLAELATHATLFKQAIAPGAYSLPSHASLLTGLYPSWHGCHFDPPQNPVGIALDKRFETLPETLRKNGYRTFAVVSNTAFLNPAFGLTQGFEYFDYRSRIQLFDQPSPIFLRSGISHLLAVYWGEEDRELFTRPARQINQETLELLDRRLQANDRFFLFMNYMDAHAPYLSPDPFNQLFPGKDPRLNARSINFFIGRTLQQSVPLQDWERNHLFSQYDGAIRYLDEELGKFFAELKTRGLYDRSLIVITSDHGEAFGEDLLMGHGLSVDQHQVQVPLIVKYPGQTRGEVVSDPASLVDVVPTVLDTIQAEFQPPWVQGISLRDAESLANRNIFAESYPAGLLRFWLPRLMRTERAIFSDKFKLIVSTRGRRELFDLDEDPNQRHDLSELMPAVAQDLSDRLALWSSQIQAGSGSMELDPETIERLRSLGYIN